MWPAYGAKRLLKESNKPFSPIAVQKQDLHLSMLLEEPTTKDNQPKPDHKHVMTNQRICLTFLCERIWFTIQALFLLALPREDICPAIISTGENR